MPTEIHTQGPAISEKTLLVWNGRLKMRVKVAGNGAPLLYLHPSAGLVWDPFLSYLAQRYTVYAPEFPGTSAGDPYAIHAIHNLADVVLVYEELVRSLGLHDPVVVGQSFGGMLAAELAATFPDLFSRVILLDPIGLWREDLPIIDWISAPAERLPGLLFKDPASRAAQSMLALPEDANIAASAIAARVWAFGCTGKFAWPIPERGLRTRLHRLNASVLLVWGRDDAIVPVRYTEEWQKEVADITVAIIDDCGHIPQVEKLSETITAVDEFLTFVEES
ncbi:alpha/beta fold hydrolase [Paraburkholderia aromaticivorans]|uniref:alpha/beta fold hydrolase n=1 Tax=Paraburkholderia aromaticivorans TaxID=2026199 RepID=UPI001455F38D|nr:alpha/beta hydrolase [Paraburkholderia aromaticivorans]